MKQAKPIKPTPIIKLEDALMYRRMETDELRQEFEHLQAKVDALKLADMENLYKKM